MEVFDTTLPGVRLIKPYVFKDHRGTYIETYNEQEYRRQGIDVAFIQDDISTSSRNVLRGIHGDDATWKLVSCLYGKFYLVVLNSDKDSPAFHQWQAFTLSADDYLQVLIPPKYGNAHLVLSGSAVFHYKQSTYYEPERQFTYRWDDPDLNISWPVKNPILSRRDEEGHRV